jgi:hypothetical protein
MNSSNSLIVFTNSSVGIGPGGCRISIDGINHFILRKNLGHNGYYRTPAMRISIQVEGLNESHSNPAPVE